MEIKCVNDAMELDNVMDFVKNIFAKISVSIPENNGNFWINEISKNSNLLLYINDNDKIIASAFAFEVDNKNITLSHFCVAKNYRNKNIGEKLMIEMENRIKTLGNKVITLGAIEVAEGFYEKMGYTGSLLIQSEKNTIDDLLSINKQYKVAWTNVYDDNINQICLILSQPDRALQKRYEETFVGCNTQMIFQKTIG